MEPTSTPKVRRVKTGIRYAVAGALAAWLCLAVAGIRDRQAPDAASQYPSAHFTANHVGDLFPSHH